MANVQARGSDATTVRDAAHEACHALDARAKKWDRDSIHRALARRYRRPVDQVIAEVRARAVERLVCERLGLAYDAAHWLHIAWLETFKGGIQTPIDFWQGAVARALTAPATMDMCEQVLALAGAA